jgi:hypothetical protein
MSRWRFPLRHGRCHTPQLRVAGTRRSPGDDDMLDRLVRSTRGDWRIWALGAAVSTACAAIIFVRRQRSARAVDAYEEWWRRREQIRANGGHNPHLFV